MKKFIALLLSASMLALPVYAEESGIFIDGNAVENAQITKAAQRNSADMIPVRAVAEKLGYDVEWNNADKSVCVKKDGCCYTLSIGEDSYKKDENNTVSLGTAPILDSSVTYVPVSFFTQLAGIEAEIDVNYVNFITEEDEIIITDDLERGNAEVIEIGEDVSEIIVEDEVIGKVRLNITEETKDNEGNPVTLDDFSVGDKVKVEYSDAMTRSIPPLNNPVSVTIQ